MRNLWKYSRATTLALALAGALIAFPSISRAQDSNTDVAAAVKAKLHNKQFQNVQVTVDQNGLATLTGNVDLYEYKMDADHRAHKVKGVKAVSNEIEVGGKEVSDAEIEKKLAPELAYSREGYGSVFDALQLQVQNGVVTLGGHAHDYPSRDAAVGLASTTPGVKEVIDNIEVDPVSPMDWDIRMKVARAIYGYPALNRYAIDPVRPIRISVQNGNVELYGSVNSQQDKQMAYIRASAVPGIFSVKNYITVEGQQPNEKQQTQTQQR